MSEGSGSFPISDYTPFGYIDNPYHSAVINRSGLVRSVPPIGFGYWCRSFPWYGTGPSRDINYISFLKPGIRMDGVLLYNEDSFRKNSVRVVSHHHTKNVMSYNFGFRDVDFDMRYFLINEDTLSCRITAQNWGKEPSRVTCSYTHIYGYPEVRWWGSDGFTGRYGEDTDRAISKISAYGDVFALGADKQSISHAVHTNEAEVTAWLQGDGSSPDEYIYVKMPGPLYNTLRFELEIEASGTESLQVCLSRGVSEACAIEINDRALAAAHSTLREKVRRDDEFYNSAALLVGDWSPSWKHGWIYDVETLRINIRPPIGIYKHPWDGMQSFTPRSVLAETMLDMMSFSYMDMDLAKEVIFGTFADSTDANIPCLREDGSVNMIGEDGSECGTSPTWGLVFRVIHSLYLRTGDKDWIRRLYPYLRNFLLWWTKNRTDKEGWFHCNNSWESGQDGSRRFPVEMTDAHSAGANAEFVRMVDLEAIMADAAATMRNYAEIVGAPEDAATWEALSSRGRRRVREMFVDGCFRDVDGNSGQPIIMTDFYDVMWLVPLAVDVATDEQKRDIRWLFDHFKQNPYFALEWASHMFPFTEAAWNCGLREYASELVAETANRTYLRTDAQVKTPADRWPVGAYELPEEYRYRIPGNATEIWPIGDGNPGCESYAWGATLPALIIRNIIGFRELAGGAETGFVLAPSLPAGFVVTGRRYGIKNLAFRKTQIDVSYTVVDESSIDAEITLRMIEKKSLTIHDADGKQVCRSEEPAKTLNVNCSLMNNRLYSAIIG